MLVPDQIWRVVASDHRRAGTLIMMQGIRADITAASTFQEEAATRLDYVSLASHLM